MRIVLFYHSLVSDWNHGNAHFLRGVTSELRARGHDVSIFEPHDSWSRINLEVSLGGNGWEALGNAYPGLVARVYDPSSLDLDSALDRADLVIVHEWSDPAFVARIGRHRTASGRYHLLFHDTHHRAVTSRAAMARYDLSGFDGVLAFGAVLREIYLARGWARRAWAWHEAADTRVFHPLEANKTGDLVWIGNWGDEERSRELREFLIEPAAALRLVGSAYGVRYPDEAKGALAAAGISYHGYVPNYEVPRLYACHRVTVHVPRRPYVEALPGIPTIRVFEALACGIPLVSAPWPDIEGLFSPGQDFLVARNGNEMRRHLADLIADPDGAQAMAARGLQAVRRRHSCAHRVDELMAICSELGFCAEEESRACPAD